MAVENRKILIVDDEPKILEVVRSYFEQSGFQVYEATRGGQALELFRRMTPDLVILDLMLPDQRGEEICQQLRRISRVPIIMLTAKAEEEDILTGLNLGADDYVTKPFSPRQLVARAEAILRRSGDAASPLAANISFNNNDLAIDFIKHEVRKEGRLINLTPNEFKILKTLLKYPQKAFTREELVSFALGDDYDGFDRTIDTHIKNLRQKIESDSRNLKYILTVHGVGYRFGGENDAVATN